MAVADVQALQAEKRFRTPMLEALTIFPDPRSALQLCELARYFAKGGDERFRKRLYEILEQQPIADWSALGEDEIVALDGRPDSWSWRDGADGTC